MLSACFSLAKRSTHVARNETAVLAQVSAPDERLAVADLLKIDGFLVRDEYEQVVLDDADQESDRHDGQEDPKADL